jgi:Asp-tRNA(Asn)/Glu-tRNA(Gln) amidotransferase A subunit family amidase
MSESSRRSISRRAVLKSALAAGAASLVGGEDPATAKTTNPDSDAITAADLATVDRVVGLEYGEPERTLMAKSLTELRGEIKAMRAASLPASTEPATHFDPRLPSTKLPTEKPGAKVSVGRTTAYDGNPESLAFATAVDLGRLLKARKITSTALTRMYVDRLKKFGPRLNCVVTLTEELAIRQAERADHEIAAGKYRGPLHGIPWGAKDLLATKGIRTTFGAKPYENQVIDEDATVVRRLEEAGAVLVAKLSMGELAMGDVWFGGLTRNPWKPTTGSSGSSAGPGSATAAGLVGFSIGTETLGSIVSPSVVNGVTGLRPTYGRVSRHGAMALVWTMDKIGPMCRGVEDCALVLNAIYGPDGQDPTAADVPFAWNPASKLTDLKVGIDSTAFASIGRNSKRKPVYDGVVSTLKSLGTELIPVTLPKQNPAFSALPGLIIDVESSASFQKLNLSGELAQLAQQGEENWPNIFRTGSVVPAADYVNALRHRTLLQHAMADALKDVDCFVTIPFASPNLFYTNLTGHPTLVTRCGMLEGLPQMVEFTGNLYREDAILRLGFAFEQATDHHTLWPDTEKLPLAPPPVSKRSGQAG